MIQFLESMPCQPYAVVAGRLGASVAPIQVILQQFKEAKIRNRVRDAAKDCLIRNIIEEFPNGSGGGNFSWKLISALSSWQSEVTVTGCCTDVENTVRSIAKALHANPPIDGWRPHHLNDSYIDDLFIRFWPT